MRLGTKSASPFETLDDIVLHVTPEYTSDEEVQRASAVPLDDEEISIFWEEARKETLGRKKLFAAANSARIERELAARFGPFVGIATHPFTLKCAAVASDVSRIRWVGPPIVPAHAIVVIMVMAYRGRMQWSHFGMLGALLISVHPSLIFAAFLLVGMLQNRRTLPKGTTKKTISNQLKEKENKKVRSLASETPSGDYDYIVVGAGLKGLYTASLLAKCGHRVAVVEEGSEIGDQCLCKPQGAPCCFALEDFHIGHVGRCDALLKAAMSTSIEWQSLGDSSNGNAYALLCCEDRAPLLMRPGAQAWVDSLAAATGTERLALAGLVGHAELLSRGLLRHVAARLPGPSSSMTKRILATEDTFGQEAALTTAAGLEKHLVDANSADLAALGALREEEESLPAARSSFAAWCCSLTQSIRGVYRPAQGGKWLLEELAKTVTEQGGDVWTDATVTGLITTSSLEYKRRAAGVDCMARGKIRQLKCTQGLVLAPESNHDASLKLGGDDLPTQRSADRVRVLIAFEAASCDELALPRNLPVIWRSATRQQAETDNKVTWIRARFSDEETGVNVVSCVVETEVSASSEAATQQRVLAQIARLFPKTAGREVYVRSTKPYKSGLLSHRPSRYAGDSRLKLRSVGVEALHYCLEDHAPLSNASGKVVAGWLAAHSALGYTQLDLQLLQRNLVAEITNLDQHLLLLKKKKQKKI